MFSFLLLSLSIAFSYWPSVMGGESFYASYVSRAANKVGFAKTQHVIFYSSVLIHVGITSFFWKMFLG